MSHQDESESANMDSDINQATSEVDKIKPRARKLPSTFLLISAVILLISSFSLRFATIESPLYWNDEACTSAFLAGEPEYWRTLHKTRITLGEVYRNYQKLKPDRDVSEFLNPESFARRQGPLYFVSIYYWAKSFGDDQRTLRLFSFLFAILQLPVFYWFALELTRSRFAAFLSMTFLGLSPFMLWFSQEARLYTLLFCFFCLSSAALIRAIRTGSLLFWSAYSISIALSFLTAPLTIFPFISHLIYIVINLFKLEAGSLKFPRLEKLLPPVLAVALALGVNAPYYLVAAGRSVSASFPPVPLDRAINIWLSKPFDFFVEQFAGTDFANFLTGIMFLIFILLVIVFFSNVGKSAVTFVLCFFSVTALWFCCSDLIGTMIPSASKYMMAVPTTIVLISAYGISVLMSAERARVRWIGRICLMFIFFAECSSSIAVSQVKERTRMMNMDTVQVIDYLRSNQTPLIITNDHLTAEFLVLSHYLNPDTEVIWTTPALEGIEPEIEKAVLFIVDEHLVNAMTEAGFEIEKAHKDKDYLFTAVRKSVSPPVD